MKWPINLFLYFKILCIWLKARSIYPILKIQFLVPKIRSRRSDGPISRLVFEKTGRSFIVCSHEPIFRTNRIFNMAPKQSQGCHAKFANAFHLPRRVLMKIEHFIFPSVFFKLTDPFVGTSLGTLSNTRQSRGGGSQWQHSHSNTISDQWSIVVFEKTLCLMTPASSWMRGVA